MVKIDGRLKKRYEDYLIRHRTFEKIDSAIFQKFGNKYQYTNNEVPLHTSIDKKVKKKSFSTDLIYVSDDLKSVLCIEETTDPTNKKEQLIAYGNISPETLQLITGADMNPYVDIFLIFPYTHRETALRVYEEMKDNISHLGRKCGLTLWYYPPSMKEFRCCGGKYSEKFPDHDGLLTSKGIGAFRIMKSAPIPYLLQFTVIRALEDEYGKTTDGIEFTKEKLLKWLKPYGIVKEERWKEMIQLGEYVGWFEKVSIDQYTGIIKHTKLSPSSISRSKKLTANFFEAIEDEKDKKQKSLTDFFDTSDNDDEDISDEDIVE